MKKNILLLILSSTIFPSFLNAKTGDTVIFIVRHAEKKDKAGETDPDLTEAGKKRAVQLAKMLADVNLKAVYSTQFKRTRNTVLPSAKAAGIKPTVIDARNFKGLIKALKTKHPGQSVLVAGHSNTVPIMLLALGTNKKVAIKEDEYSNLFVVTLRSDDSATAIHLHYGDQ